MTVDMVGSHNKTGYGHSEGPHRHLTEGSQGHLIKQYKPEQTGGSLREV